MKGNSSKLEEDRIEGKKLALLEAALYVAGRPLDLRTLGSIIGTRSRSKVLKLARVSCREIQELHLFP